jgi:hypothetical protein
MALNQSSNVNKIISLNLKREREHSEDDQIIHFTTSEDNSLTQRNNSEDGLDNEGKLILFIFAFFSSSFPFSLSKIYIFNFFIENFNFLTMFLNHHRHLVLPFLVNSQK